MSKEIRPAIVFVVALALITGLAYPLVMTGVAGAFFPDQAQGSLIERDGKVIGCLIGQQFTSDKYFRGRPSATTAPDLWIPARPSLTLNAANSGGSNLGPTNKALAERVQGDVEKLKQENGSAPVPIDVVTTTGSGLDPHISPAAAQFRSRVLQRRVVCLENCLQQLINAHVEGRMLGLLGEPRVNVLALNLALDREPSK